jgi:hypothetical protein
MGHKAALPDFLRFALLATIGITMMELPGKIAEANPELAAVIIAERLRQLQVRYEALG